MHSINYNQFNNMFPIPTSIADKYISLASADALRVILYIFKNSNIQIDSNTISEKLNIPLADVIDALNYWTEVGVLVNNIADVAAVCNPPETTNYNNTIICEKSNDINTANTSVRVISSTPTRLYGSELSKRVNSSKDLRYLIKQAEHILGKMLIPNDVSVLTSIYDFAGAPVDIIIMGIEYCVSVGKKSIRSIESTIYKWLDLGLDTHDKINDYIAYCNTLNTAENEIRQVFGASDRAFTTNQKKYIETWTITWGFSVEIIKLAYDKTVDTTGKVSYPYINKILQNWHENGYTTITDIEAEDKKTNNLSASYDLNEFNDLSTLELPVYKKKK